MITRLQQKYNEEVVPQLKEKFGVTNKLALPRIQKVVINMGVGQAVNDMRIMDSAVADLTNITGQKPIITRAKEAISNFKLRKGMPIGCKVTMRGARMYEFLDRLITFALPRIRDFNGVSFKAFDRMGNYTLGLQEQSIFPEMDLTRITHIQGMDITIVFNKGPKEQTAELLRLLGFPFRKKTHLGEV